MSRHNQYSPILRHSRKLSWKKGGVDCRVSRRERDFPDTFTPTIDHLPLRTPAIPLEPDQFNIENSANEKTMILEKISHRFFSRIFSPEIIFSKQVYSRGTSIGILDSEPEQIPLLPHGANRVKSPIPNEPKKFSPPSEHPLILSP